MKKQLLSILLLCCMVLTLLPTTAFAEGGTEEPLVCTCETACTAESMNADCPVCGVEGASAENCAKYVGSADDVPTQTEGKAVTLADDEPTPLTEDSFIYYYGSYILYGGNYILTHDMTLDGNISIGFGDIRANVTLDLNGCTLETEPNCNCTLFVNGSLTLKDSKNSGAIVSPNHSAVTVCYGSTFTMESGNIRGGEFGVTVNGYYASATFKMNGGSVTGGICLESPSVLYANGGTVTGLSEFYGTVLQEEDTTGTVFDGVVINETGKDIPGTLNGGTITGSGTQESPYLISNAEGLKWFRDEVNSADEDNNYNTLCAKLMNDIDLGGDAWTPIAPETITYEGTTYGYCGTFDGGGHTISGLNVSGEFDFAGLFGRVTGGTIKNLTVAGSVTGSSDNTSVAGGIAGSAQKCTIEACANLCSVSAGQYVGGIVGQIHNATVRDCYNVGTVTGGSNAGGIVGMTTSQSNNTIVNCYNVGNVSASPYAGGILGEAGPVDVSNCYYLEGTAEKAIGFGDVNYPAARTEKEFADGTVLALLKAGDRGSNADPWDSTCKYVTAAKMTLPVFKGQGDAHEHSGKWTSNGDNTHIRTCACGVTETAKCSGGTATCTEKAKCKVCNTEYGEKNPTNHTKLVNVPAKAATTSAEGNIEYWHCEGCDQYYKDAAAQDQITQAKTVIPKRQSSSGGSSSPSYAVTVPDKPAHGSVSVSPTNARRGSTVTVSVKPDSGYVLETLTVTDNKVSELQLTDKGDGKYTFVMPSGKVEVKATFQEDNSVLNAFYDVPNDAYYFAAVKWAIEKGITNGISETLFGPDQPCTRAQIVTFLWRAAGSPVVNYAMDMTDVPADAYYTEAVRWALSEGITTGTGEGKFSPDETCTRAQGVTFLHRALGKTAAAAANFTDVPADSYYAQAVAWAGEAGVTNGVSADQFAPTAPCTRAQIVTFLYRAYQG